MSGIGSRSFAKTSQMALYEAYEESLKIYIRENRLVIENLPKDTIIEIYSIVGTKVSTIRAKAGYGEYFLSLSKGYYIVKVEKVVKKIAIK
ncbi:MAG: T9SS type A sorting domain-containing protein [Dysgonomonadaceae bacterium]|jgi:hypothetical protein|nr:T9SS type A sorting domain-containing protein [Dysgonamonadaceae bacterium]HOT65280.1 T9SS type A sorting domain-containing protein [Dysgonamonadaceae bacterium]HOV35188.1 T9SS type A sorting domain-containing protein [Dysgonamonadaceae bacterium]HQI44130.1 T9SS type A sorting domain-containing protein [Dysgonamonadaceae bacterium]